MNTKNRQVTAADGTVIKIFAGPNGHYLASEDAHGTHHQPPGGGSGWWSDDEAAEALAAALEDYERFEAPDNFCELRCGFPHPLTATAPQPHQIMSSAQMASFELHRWMDPGAAPDPTAKGEVTIVWEKQPFLPADGRSGYVVYERWGQASAVKVEAYPDITGAVRRAVSIFLRYQREEQAELIRWVERQNQNK